MLAPRTRSTTTSNKGRRRSSTTPAPTTTTARPTAGPLSSRRALGAAGANRILCLVEKSASTVFKLLAFKAMGVARFPDGDGVFPALAAHVAALPTANSWREVLSRPTIAPLHDRAHPHARLLSAYLDKVVAHNDSRYWLDGFNGTAAYETPRARFSAFVRVLVNSTTGLGPHCRPVLSHFTLQTEHGAVEQLDYEYLRLEDEHLWFAKFLRARAAGSCTERMEASEWPAAPLLQPQPAATRRCAAAARAARAPRPSRRAPSTRAHAKCEYYESRRASSTSGREPTWKSLGHAPLEVPAEPPPPPAPPPVPPPAPRLPPSPPAPPPPSFPPALPFERPRAAAAAIPAAAAAAVAATAKGLQAGAREVQGESRRGQVQICLRARQRRRAPPPRRRRRRRRRRRAAAPGVVERSARLSATSSPPAASAAAKKWYAAALWRIRRSEARPAAVALPAPADRGRRGY